MDPISILGPLIGCANIVGDALQYICNVHDAPEQIQMVKRDLSDLLTLLNSVQRLVQNNENLAIHFETGPFDAAMRAIKGLLDLLGGNFTDHLSVKVVAWRNMKWPLKETKLREIRGELDRQKASINLSLTTALLAIAAAQAREGAALIQPTLQRITELNNRLDRMERNRILNHCLPQNEGIAALHRNRKGLQEPETCDWISREGSFRDWLRPRVSSGDLPRFVWIHGIPGAGKTVLASSGESYCLYSRNQDETIPFLKHILRLLCRKKQFMVLPRFQEAYDREEELSVEDLLNCLEEVPLGLCDNIIVDAVDESKPRGNLLDVLCRIGTNERFWKVSLLFTSREESDITESIRLLGNAVACISMSNNNVRKDIKRYIHAQLNSVPFFLKHYDSKLIEDVETRLTLRAKGMFRWAVCQLDVLKNTRGREQVLGALETLPKDIFETYERILKEIPQADQEFAKTALALICSDTAKIPTAEVLVKASLWSVPFNDIRKYTVETLKESCGSLISLTSSDRTPLSSFTRTNERPAPFHNCSLAHYTVKEYLFSSNVANGAAQFFALSDQIVRNIDLKVIFAGLSHFGLFNDTHQAGRRQAVLSRYEEYCLRMTEKALKDRRADILRDEDIRKIVTKSLTPGSPHFEHLNTTHGIVRVMRDKFPQWQMLCSFNPAFRRHSLSGLLVNLAALDWRNLADRYLESPDFKDLSRQEKRQVWTETFTLRDRKTETLLGYCLREGHLKFLRVLVRHGASFDHEPEALYTAMKVYKDNPVKALEALKLLLSAGAYPDPAPSVSRGETDQELAISELAYDWVELLLDEGADVNRFATPDGVIPSSFGGTNPKYDEATLQEIGQQTALEICSWTQPSWIQDSPGDVNKIRESIKVLLKRHGAEETRGETEDESMMDIGLQSHNGGEPELIDLTMVVDDTTGHQII
ncbi:hypothetical protein F5B21DRAFT_519163 [Xylaria acuta]|nr:hypothetical protein F5B21DRAFT_519163 [Xylaria acuta]